MRLLVFNHRGDRITGGVEQRLIRFGHVAPGYGIDLTVILPEHGPLEDCLNSVGVRTRVFDVDWQPRNASGWARYMQGLSRRVDEISSYVSSLNIDVVHTNTFNNFEGALTAIRIGRPHIWHVRSIFGTDPDSYGFGGFDFSPADQAQILASMSDGILSVSAGAAEVFSSAGIDVKVIHNGIDIAEFVSRANAYPNSNLRLELGIEPQAPIIACVSRFSPEKDLETFVATCRKIHDARSDVHFIVAGDMQTNQSYAEFIRSVIESHELQSNFHLLGERHDLAALYPQFDVLMVTSRNEALSNVILEAMASGLPVVSTRCVGGNTIIENGRSGLLADIGSHDELAVAALQCLTDPALSAVLGVGGGQRVLREFSESHHYDALVEYYKNIIKDFDPAAQRRRRVLAEGMLTLATRHANTWLELEGLRGSLVAPAGGRISSAKRAIQQVARKLADLGARIR